MREDVDAKVIGIDVDLHRFGFRQHGDGHRRGVDPTLRLRNGNALHAVHAALVLEATVHAVAADARDPLLDSASSGPGDRQRLDLPALRLGVPAVHAEECAGEQRRLFAAGARSNLENHVLVVVRVPGNEQRVDRALDLGAERLEACGLRASHVAQLGIRVAQHGASALDLIERLPIADRRLRDRPQLRELLGETRVLGRGPRHVGVGQPLLEVSRAAFDVFDAVDQTGH